MPEVEYARCLRTKTAIAYFCCSIGCAIWSAPVSAQLQTLGSVFLDQNSPGVAGTAEDGDLFGAALATGDYNCDGFADLAVGVPWEDVGGAVHAGAVNVFYGGPAGLTSAEIWTQGDNGVAGASEAHDHFGVVLATFRWRDLDNDGGPDGCDSLAVGAPDEDVDSGPFTHVDAGAVFLFRGKTDDGLIAAGLIVQGRDSVPESPEDYDRFGAAISQGPLVETLTGCGGQYGDYSLVIAAPGEGLGLLNNGDGALLQLAIPCPWARVDCSFGVGTCRVISADDFALPSGVDPYDHFGESLAYLGRELTGNLPPEGWEFLAVGIPSANVPGGDSSIGAVLEADPSWAANSGYWTQDTSGVLGTAEAGDQFGGALAVGDFDDDGVPDLAIGIPGEDDGSTINSGAVQVLRNTSSGLTATGDFLAAQGSLVAGETEAYDHVGRALVSGDFNGDGVADLAVGAPGENLPAPHVVVDAGAVNVLYGVGGSGLSTVGAQQFDADDVLFNAAAPGDAFGKALAAGDFDGNGIDDLAIGLPGPDDGSDTSWGLIAVLYGADGGALGAVDWEDSTPTVNEGPTLLQVPVVRTGSAVVPISIAYSTANGTATAGSDYAAASGVLSWAAGELGSKNIQILILNDTRDESNETFTIRLTGGSGAVTRPADAVVTIVDNDTGGSLQFSLPVYTVSEDGISATAVVTRTGGAASGVTVNYATSNGTALAGEDYTATSGQLSFGFGETSQSFQVPIVNDAVPEASESIVLTLSNPGGGATLGVFSGTVVVILNNDGCPTGVAGTITVNTVQTVDATIQACTKITAANGFAVSPGVHVTLQSGASIVFLPGSRVAGSLTAKIALP